MLTMLMKLIKLMTLMMLMNLNNFMNLSVKLSVKSVTLSVKSVTLSVKSVTLSVKLFVRMSVKLFGEAVRNRNATSCNVMKLVQITDMKFVTVTENCF